VTSLESSSGSPSWFPDGRRILFDSDKEGHTEVYATDITTLVPHRLTNESSDDVTPSVSRDGKWIYFSSRCTGRLEVWRMPAEGGEAVQVTRKGGWRPMESPDGKVVYYLVPDSPDVWKVPAAGEQETRLLGPVGEFFAVGADGLCFIEIGRRLYVGSTGNSLKFFSFAMGTTEKVADIKLKPQLGLSVSPDGRYVLAALNQAYQVALCCRPLRGLNFRVRSDPGVPLRSTPGFMLSPAPRASQSFATLNLVRAS
jgi:hypothetical protein